MAVDAVKKIPAVKTAAAAIAVGLLAWLGWERNNLFRDDVTLYAKTLEKNPDCWVLHNDLGSADFRLKKTSEAIEHYEEARRLKPDSLDVLCNLGVAYTDADRVDEAIALFQRALLLQPYNPEAHYKLGNAYFKAGKWPEAASHFQEALARKPECPEAHLNWGKILRKNARQVPEALEHFQKAIEQKPDWIDAHMQFAITLSGIGRREEALAEANKALGIARKNGNDAAVKKIEEWIPSL